MKIQTEFRRAEETKQRERAHSRRWTIAFYVFLTVCGILLFKAASDYAYIQRGYKAVGGEFFLLLLPLWYWLISRTIGDFIDTITDSGSKNQNIGGKNDD